MYILELLVDDSYHPIRRIFNVVLQLAFHWVGGWILSGMFLLMFTFFSVPMITIFGENCFGMTFQQSLSALERDFSVWRFFTGWNWFYTIAVCLGWMFPVVHLLVGDVD
jgi:hypothetical protein